MGVKGILSLSSPGLHEQTDIYLVNIHIQKLRYQFLSKTNYLHSHTGKIVFWVSSPDIQGPVCIHPPVVKSY
jgi:cell division protein FtsL